MRISVLFFLVALLFMSALTVILGGFVSMFRRTWARSYEQLGKRYHGEVHSGFPLSRPSMTFRYGKANCSLRNVNRAPNQGGPLTQLTIDWRDPRLKLHLSTLGPPVGYWNSRKLNQVVLPTDLGLDSFFVFSSSTEKAAVLVTTGAAWALRQLAGHLQNSGVEVFFNRGKMTVSQPGFVKEYQTLDDFVRFSLELHDQFMLAFREHGIQFMNEDSATIVDDVKCPICSEQVRQDMVCCVRCKTPHCGDCWEYNGQCATFACGETRFIRTGPSHDKYLSSGT